MGWRNSSWVIGWVCVFTLALRICGAGEVGGGPGDKVRLVPLKFQMQLPWCSESPVVHELTKSPKVEQPPEALPILMVPEGTINLAAEVPVTASDNEPIIGRIEGVTDGVWEIEGDLELAPGMQWVQIDLRASCPIYAIRLLREVGRHIYFDVIVQVSDDPTFGRDVQTVFNNDHDGSSGRGKGTDRLYIESRFGKTIVVPGISGRYVRFYSNGNTRDDANHYIEVEVYGVPTAAWRRQIAEDRAHWRTVKGLLERLHVRHPNAAVYEGENIVGLTGWLYCDEDFDAVAQISTLRSLSIKGSGPPQRTTSAGTGRLRELKQLTKLEVEKSRALLDVLLEHLPAFDSIEELSVNFSAQPSDLPQITRLKKLRKLGLWMCQMNDDDLAELAGLEKLEELGLATTNLLITDAGLVHLQKLAKLKLLDIRWTEVTPAGMKRLQQALPELRIEYEEPPAILRRARE